MKMCVCERTKIVFFRGGETRASRGGETLMKHGFLKVSYRSSWLCVNRDNIICQTRQAFLEPCSSGKSQERPLWSDSVFDRYRNTH